MSKRRHSKKPFSSSKPLKILVYGHRGWIGQQFLDVCQDWTPPVNVVCGSSRCDNVSDVRKEVQQHTPTHVIAFIGRTHGSVACAASGEGDSETNRNINTIDYLEEPGKLVENVRDNLFAPFVLASVCKEAGAHFTYLGTGCIFSYDEKHPLISRVEQQVGFMEDDSPNFTGSSYSTVKGFTDQMMGLFDNVLNLRIRMPITGRVHPRNFITKITRYEYVCSVPNSMTVLPELLPLILVLMSNGETGTLNFTNPGTISHNAILRMYQEIVDSNFTWKNFTQEEQRKVLKSERSNNCLDTSKLQLLFPYVKSIHDSVRSTLRNYKRDLDQQAQNLAQSFLSSTRGNVNVLSLLSPTPSSPEPPENPVSGRVDANCNDSASNSTVTACLDYSVPKTVSPTHGRTFLITGGCGFIGSHFINYVMTKDPAVFIINLDAMYYSASTDYVKKEFRTSRRYTLVRGKVQSMELLRHVFETYNITHVVHFAAQSHVDNSFKDSIQYTQDNILGTHVLLEACRLHNPGLKRFIHISTDEVYGESRQHESSKLEDSSILAPTNPYAATKAAAEMIAHSYFCSYRVPIIITRGNNVYGTHQYPEKLIPKFVNQLLHNTPVTVHGDGSNLRTFVHVSDVVRAVELVLDRGRIGEVYNIGGSTKQEHSVLSIAQRLIRLIRHTEKYEEWITYVDDRPFNDTRYFIDHSKLTALGWAPTVDLNTGLQEIIENARRLQEEHRFFLTDED